jgi:hypothetical protein
MDEISILKNRLAYFSNRISYELPEEYEIDDSYLLEEKMSEERVDEQDDEYEQEEKISEISEDDKKDKSEKENLKLIKNLIKIGVIDLNRDGTKLVSTLTNIPHSEVKKLIEKYYDKFEKIQKKVDENIEKRVQK